MNKEDTFILVSNDDGIHAKGIRTLMKVAQEFGKVWVVAPIEGQSGMSHAITVKRPIRIHKHQEGENIKMYSCDGTPVDCIKLALNQLLDRKPDLILSGINHGSNSSASIVYSGTMAAAIEGCINQIPSIGLSYTDYDPEADLDHLVPYVRVIIRSALEKGIPEGICLNVNIPKNLDHSVKGFKAARQNKGFWKEEFEKRFDPRKRQYFWLTGEFYNMEPDSRDTDEWALQQNYISIVPVSIDLTAYEFLKELQNWESDMNRNHI